MQISRSKHFSVFAYMALAVITATGAFLRLFHLKGTSLSNDELSALTRTLYPDYKQLLKYGVETLDTHPAGIQTFLYFYTRTFGIDEITLRLPFAICGILTILVCFFLFRKWFGTFCALFTSACVAFLQYPVFYSQLARPYSVGLFLSMLLLLSWTYLYDTNTSKTRKILFATAYIILTTLCAYTHYLCLLFAALVWLISFFYIPKKDFKLHFLLGFISAVLFIPHVQIFVAQLNKSGLDWLGKPGMDYLSKYIFYIFNESWLVFISSAIIILFSAIYAYRKKWFEPNKYRGFALLLFFSLFLITFLKSYFGKPVLQYSVLIFAFPLLPAFLFSFIDDLKFSNKIKYAVLFVFSAVCVLSLFSEKKYYSTEHYGQFKPIAQTKIGWDKKFGAQNITCVLSTFAPFYFRYYLPQKQDSANIKLYRCDQPLDQDSLFKIVKNSRTKYFAYGWSNIAHPEENERIIRLRYNKLKDTDQHFNSSISLFEFTNHDFSAKLKLQDSSNKNLFDIPYTQALKNALILAEAEIELSNLSPEIEMVASIENNKKITFWATQKVTDYFKPGSKKAKISWFKILPNEVKQNDILRIYIWNRSDARMQVRNFAVQLF